MGAGEKKKRREEKKKDAVIGLSTEVAYKLYRRGFIVKTGDKTYIIDMDSVRIEAEFQGIDSDSVDVIRGVLITAGKGLESLGYEVTYKGVEINSDETGNSNKN